MRRKYKNQLFQLLASSKFGIEGFDILESQEIDGHPADVIYLNDTPFHFIIRNNPEDFNLFDVSYIQYAPEFPRSDIFPPSDYINFDIVCTFLDDWLARHISEFFLDKEEPDLWAEFRNTEKTTYLNEIDFDSQSNFSYDEQRQIELSLKELKLLISTSLKTSNEQQELVNARLDYLIEATKRLNKFDWKGIALSAILSISTALSLDTNKGQLLFELFRRVFTSIRLLPDH